LAIIVLQGVTKGGHATKHFHLKYIFSNENIIDKIPGWKTSAGGPAGEFFGLEG